MKKSTVLIALTMGVALMMTATGCKHRGIDTTNIPGRTIKPGQFATEDLGKANDTGGTLTTTEPPTTITNPVNSDGTIGFKSDTLIENLLAKPHHEDRNKFAEDTIYFETDSAAIKGPEQAKLERIASYFKGNTTEGLMIEGYCDERGTEGYNVSLGDRRALAIREYLATLGVESGRIGTKSFGEANPVDTGHNEAAWHKNRRGFSVLIVPDSK